jgi:hypothetical protein
MRSPDKTSMLLSFETHMHARGAMCERVTCFVACGQFSESLQKSALWTLGVSLSNEVSGRSLLGRNGEDSAATLFRPALLEYLREAIAHLYPATKLALRESFQIPKVL